MKDAAQVSYHHRLILAIEILFKTLSFISFGLRLWARHMSKATLWCDDYIMGLGLADGASQKLSDTAWAHTSLMSPAAIGRYSSFYVTTLPTVKISVLLFYHRIFPQRSFRRVTYVMSVVLVLFLLCNWLVSALQCLPIHSFWQPQVPHHCVDRVSYYIANGWINATAGIWYSAEVEILVISGNLPLLKPLFLRAVALLSDRHLRYRISNHEQSSDIFELSNSASNTKVGKWEGPERSVIAQGGKGNCKGRGSLMRDPIPSDRILVEMDLEQNFISLGVEMPTEPRES
ncbi:MAG: hypothetical protein L6R37_007765 [Teloschistes peruensis]|nr:MAG: hypothetical protein L6R37_007765 [Teloschistes peruensis]